MFGYYYGIDLTYIVLVLPAILLGLWAQMRVKSTYARYSQVRASRGVTADQVARLILDMNGLRDVPIQRIAGSLTDHYDPRDRVIRLSDSVYGSPSIAAIGVAAHEVGHAVQHATGYAPMKLRSAIVSVTNIGSTLSMPLILIGLVLNSSGLAMAGGPERPYGCRAHLCRRPGAIPGAAAAAVDPGGGEPAAGLRG